MSTEQSTIDVAGLSVQVIRKDIKNLHLAVYPPDGRVRVAVPTHIDDDTVRLAVIDRLAWVRRQKERFEAQPRQPERRCVSGETHYFLGRRYTLHVDERDAAPSVSLPSKSKMALAVRPGTGLEARQKVLSRWYRRELRPILAAMLEEWQPRIGVSVEHWSVRHMRTKWGTCNIDARRILFNTELAKKPVAAIEYLAVHELLHLLAPHHDDRFAALLDEHMPDWRHRRNILNAAPLAHEDWSY